MININTRDYADAVVIDNGVNSEKFKKNSLKFKLIGSQLNIFKYEGLFISQTDISEVYIDGQQLTLDNWNDLTDSFFQ